MKDALFVFGLPVHNEDQAGAMPSETTFPAATYYVMPLFLLLGAGSGIVYMLVAIKSALPSNHRQVCSRCTFRTMETGHNPLSGLQTVIDPLPQSTMVWVATDLF